MLGWSPKRIVTQIVSESLTIGAIGAVIGIALGFAGAALITAIASKLSAIVPKGSQASATTVTVRLAAHVSLAAALAAVGLGLAGALIAGTIGARRATRLQPADAFTQLQ